MSSTAWKTESTTRAGLLERLSEGPVLCAEGYVFELERRGYLQAGPFVPEVVLDHPEQVRNLHDEFLHAGSDVVLAFTYYAHREKLKLIGKHDLLEPLNRGALKLAKEAAATTGALVAGNVCNTNAFDPADPDSRGQVREMFAEQVEWAAEAGVDFVVGETFRYGEEALLALEAIRAADLPAVITLTPGHEPATREDWTLVDACKRLADAGAAVVGLNCARGPATMLPLLEELVGAVDVPVAGLPVPYRTTLAQPTFQSLRDPGGPQPQGEVFPTALDPFTCNRYEIADFTRRARAAGVRYLGLCCGAAPHHVRSMAETLGRSPAASRYSEDMSKHVYLGTDPARHNLEFKREL